MSAPEVATELDRIMNELGSVRFALINARQVVLDSKAALSRLESMNPRVHVTETILHQMSRDLGDEVQTLLSAHEYLTEFRISLL